MISHWPIHPEDSKHGKMSLNRLKPGFQQEIAAQCLPGDFIANLENLYIPLAKWVVNNSTHQGKTFGLGIRDGQGSTSILIVAQPLLSLLRRGQQDC